MDSLRAATISGVAAMVTVWAFILTSMHLNPWFSVTANALSDLGGGNLTANGHPAPTDPWVYNAGLMVTAVIIVAFAGICISMSRDKLETVGLSFFVISALFLALIGIYHEGTYPHDFVSIWYFILASIAFVPVSLSLALRRRPLGAGMLITTVLAWIIYATVRWQSVAEGEIFGILVIELIVSLYLTDMWRHRSEEGAQT